MEQTIKHWQKRNWYN